MRPDDLYSKHKKVKEKSLSKFSKLKDEYSELKSEFEKTNETIESLFKEICQENSYKRSLVFDEIKKKCLEKYKTHMSSCVSVYFVILDLKQKFKFYFL